LQRLQPLIEHLEVGRSRQLKGAVRALSKAVIRERDAGNITDEADALIRLNAEYMLRHMEEERKEQGR